MPTPRVHGVHSANVEEVGHTFCYTTELPLFSKWVSIKFNANPKSLFHSFHTYTMFDKFQHHSTNLIEQVSPRCIGKRHCQLYTASHLLCAATQTADA